jgi:riboflavin synthase
MKGVEVFTGIVEEVGTLVVREEQSDAAVLRIRAQRVLEGVALGDSIAVNGVCLTVTGVEPDGADGAGVWSTDVMAETLTRSSLGSAVAGQPVNLERAVTPHTRLGGHLMQGHVDGVGQILVRTPGEHWEVVRIALPPALARYVVEKGSVAVDGVSLTVSAVSAADLAEPWFEVSLIPTTLRETTLGARAPGEPVNLEVDVIAKYVERLLGASSGSGPASSRGDTARLGTHPTSASEEDS